MATVLCLLIGYPMALAITRVSKSWRNILLMLVILPFWTSFLLRVYAWIGTSRHQQLVQQGADVDHQLLAAGDMAIRSLPMMNSNSPSFS